MGGPGVDDRSTRNVGEGFAKVHRHAPPRSVKNLSTRARELPSDRPDDAGAHLLLGSSLLREYIARSGSAVGFFPGSYFLYGTSLNDFGRPADSAAITAARSIPQDAGEHLARAHARTPASGIPYLGLGQMFEEAGNRKEALQYFRMAAAKGSPDAKGRLKELAGKG